MKLPVEINHVFEWFKSDFMLPVFRFVFHTTRVLPEHTKVRYHSNSLNIPWFSGSLQSG
eukprot:UN23084